MKAEELAPTHFSRRPVATSKNLLGDRTASKTECHLRLLYLAQNMSIKPDHSRLIRPGRLLVVQQPQRARMCGFGDKVSTLRTFRQL
jgi:hypothetical protein